MQDFHSNFEVDAWQAMTPEQKKEKLFLNQKNTLDLFLERNAISLEQYQKSLTDLMNKMGMQHLVAEPNHT